MRTMKAIVQLLWLCPAFVVCNLGLNEGETCYDKGMRGICTNAWKCPKSLKNIRQALRTSIICSFDGDVPILCCTRDDSPPKVTTTKRPVPRTTTEYTPAEEDYIDLDPQSSSTCKPLDPSITAPRNSQKAWNKCLEYQERLVFPCEKSKGLSADASKVRGNYCRHNYNKLITGGVDAAYGEFPHMALLSFSKESEIDSLTFGCGGSLISEWFILTAAHCTYERDVGPVSYAVVGILRKSQGYDKDKVYKIGDIIKPDEYVSPFGYHDIALLKTQREIKLNSYTVPACLDVGSESNYDEALATGWGAVLRRGEHADTLQKVQLNKFRNQECSRHFPRDKRKLPRGFDRRIQMCYGDKEESKDSCPGDSGGPLQLKIKSIRCMYSVFGVISTGHGCGYIGVPALYTKVRHYVPWIERIVWPDN